MDIQSIKERIFKPKDQLDLEEVFVGRFEKIYLRIIEFGVYLTLFTPLVLAQSFYFPYVSPKTIFFRIAVSILFIFYVLLVVSNRKYLPKFNLLTVSVTVFLVITFLTSITGVNFEKSFWSTFERMTGLFSFIYLFVFFIILISVFREKKYWERALTVSILVGVIICFLVLFPVSASSYGGGTLGNVSFLAAYLLFDIFFATILLFTKKGPWQVFYGMALAIMLFILFRSLELPRGVISVLFPGFLFIGLGYMFFSGKRLLKRLAPVALVLVVLVGIGISQTSFFKEKIIDLKDLPEESRRIVWDMGLEGWRERPWLGWGQENFNIPFAKYFDPELPPSGDLWYDRVHNVVLDVAVTSGILGLLSYLSIFGIAILGLLRICSGDVEKRNLFLPLGMIALLAVYFLQNIWVFDMISTYMMFFFSLAFISFLISPPKKEQNTACAFPEERNLFHVYIGTLLIVLSISAIYFGGIQPARASRYVVLGMMVPLEEVTATYLKAIQASPMSIVEVPEQFVKRIEGFARIESPNPQLLKDTFQTAADELEKAIAKNPDDLRLYLMLGRHYNNFFLVTGDPKELELAEETFGEAMRISPQNLQVYWSLGQTRLSQGKIQEAIELIKKSVDLEPRYGPAHWYLAMTYRIAGNYELALEEVKAAEAKGFFWRQNLGYVNNVIEIYQNLGHPEELLELYVLDVSLNPNNIPSLARLAVSLANAGRFQEAWNVANEVLRIDPSSAPQVGPFLEQLKPYLGQ